MLKSYDIYLTLTIINQIRVIFLMYIYATSWLCSLFVKFSFSILHYTFLVQPKFLFETTFFAVSKRDFSDIIKMFCKTGFNFSFHAKLGYQATGFFSTTDIIDLFIFQLKQPDKPKIHILLVKLDWEIYILTKIAIYMNFS